MGKPEAPSTFADRLRSVIGGASVHAFALRSGVGDTLLRKYLAGSEPGLEKAAKIAKAAGVRLQWLATGEGPVREGEGEEKAEPSTTESAGKLDQAVDDKLERLLQDVVTELAAWHEELGGDLPPAELGIAVKMVYRYARRQLDRAHDAGQADLHWRLKDHPDLLEILTPPSLKRGGHKRKMM